MVGLDLLDYDREWNRRDDPLSRALLALLVRITADSRTMMDEAPNPRTEHTQDAARRLRAATDRLHAIVYALTAVLSVTARPTASTSKPSSNCTGLATSSSRPLRGSGARAARRWRSIAQSRRISPRGDMSAV